MGMISSALDRPTRTAAVISTEDEALTVVGTIAGIFSAAAGGTLATAEARLDLLSRSGLFGISVPTEYGGIDVSNTVLADVCAVASAQSATLGEILAAHFVVLEELRSHGTDGQRSGVFSAALSGARLARAVPRRNGEEAETLPLAASGLAWRLSGEALCTPCTRHADWLLVPTRNDGGKAASLLLPTRIDGLHYVANNCEPANGAPQSAEHVLFKDVLIDGDALLHAPGEVAVPQSLGLLLGAARQLGAGQRSLGRVLDKADGDIFEAGLLSARLAAAQAMVAEAGRAIDAAQIGIADQHRTNAFLAATAARAVAQEAADHLRAAGGGAQQEGLPSHLAEALRQSGRLRREAHRNPEDGEN
ncbi:acyl-CoA dehydrogenase family protein [Shinella sp. CPCC 100929]|uniref:Acyl-CoA dehydrogenase family protein n=1 Tax=Shinella lacus TaxID=2654216 RepID=A0ABT1R4G5_9HYPH|nr:acyl-CoA dehydrogenase family protein [Shinella lacus]MCQ4630070.1 acyl-CoA dehydrogenase family protein [Shinella lacus]